MVLESLIAGGLDKTLATEVGLHDALDLTVDLSPLRRRRRRRHRQGKTLRCGRLGLQIRPSSPCCRRWHNILCTQTLTRRLAFQQWSWEIPSLEAWRSAVAGAWMCRAACRERPG